MPRLVSWTFGLTGALLVLGGASYYRFAREIPVQVAVPNTDVEVRVFGIGTVEAQVLSKVGFQVAGKIVALSADQGDFVRAGAPLAKLDGDAQGARLLKSGAAKRQAAANLTRVRAQRDRIDAIYQQKKSVNVRRQTLVGREAVSQETAEDAQAAEAIALSDLRVVEADAAIAAVLEEDAAAQHQLDAILLAQHELEAPFDARVIARHKELGSIASAGEGIFTLIAPSSIWVRAHLDESLSSGLAVGQRAFVRLRSEPNQLFETEIVRIDQENDRATEERRVYLRCRICDPRHQLRFLGEQAEVEIVKRVIARGLLVPSRFIEGYDGREGTVWVLENGRLGKRRVAIEDRLLDGRVHVTAPLPNDVRIVIEPGDGLREGRAARAAPPRGN